MMSQHDRDLAAAFSFMVEHGPHSPETVAYLDAIDDKQLLTRVIEMRSLYIRYLDGRDERQMVLWTILRIVLLLAVAAVAFFLYLSCFRVI